MDALGLVTAFMMLSAGAFLSARLGFFQFTHLGRALAAPFEKSRNGAGVTPFQAMATALGSSVGTANIAGVAGAIILGGPGAVFWMWAAGLFGMGTKFCEIVLAMLYRKSGAEPGGGPMLYMERGLGRFGRTLARLFSLFGCFSALFGTALVQSNTLALAANGLLGSLGALRPSAASSIVIGVLTALLAGAVIFGGAKRIGRFSERAVPVMAAAYAIVSLAAIFMNRARLAGAFLSVVRGAFGIRSAAGGFIGAGFIRAMKVGVARGVYSNEAGVGSAPIAHAASSETDPVRQGLLGVFEVFADTIVMCTLTAFVILTSGLDFSAYRDGTALAFAAFSHPLGAKPAAVFLSASVLLFAFTSIVGWEYYGERCFSYLAKGVSAAPFRAAFLLLIPVGAAVAPAFAWRAGELFNYLMAAPNVTALLLLSGKAAREARAYKMFEKSRKRSYNKG